MPIGGHKSPKHSEEDENVTSSQEGPCVREVARLFVCFIMAYCRATSRTAQHDCPQVFPPLDFTIANALRQLLPVAGCFTSKTSKTTILTIFFNLDSKPKLVTLLFCAKLTPTTSDETRHGDRYVLVRWFCRQIFHLTNLNNRRAFQLLGRSEKCGFNDDYLHHCSFLFACQKRC